MRTSEPPNRGDRGASLIDLLLAATLIGLASSALAATASSVVPATQSISTILDHTRDALRIQNWIPSDLETAITVDTSPTALAHLPGTNVFTTTDTEQRVVSYRYVPSNRSWNLIRFSSDDPEGTVSPTDRITIATELLAPPQFWQPDTAASHAVTFVDEVLSGKRNREVAITFATGQRLRIGGILRPTATPPSTAHPLPPTGPPSRRCGGSIAIVLNTSSGIWAQGAAATVVGDITRFIESLRGTPTFVRIVSFDRLAVSFFPDVAVGTYVDLLTSSSSWTSMNTKLGTLATTSTSWRTGRNWEDGLWQSARQSSGTILAQPVDVVIFLTDGSPNRNRTNTSSDTDTTFHTTDLSRAVTAADTARNSGATLFGILVGNAADATAGQHLISVFGSAQWIGDTAITPMDRASVFIRPAAEGFSRLDDIFDLLARWQCAGTITLQQRVVTGGVTTVPTESWSFEVSVENHPDQPISLTVGSGLLSATADLSVVEDETRVIVVRQTPRIGFRHLSTACTDTGTPIATETALLGEGTTRVRITAPAHSIIACTLTAETVP